jgi:hypothetical protein
MPLIQVFDCRGDSASSGYQYDDSGHEIICLPAPDAAPYPGAAITIHLDASFSRERLAMAMRKVAAWLDNSARERGEPRLTFLRFPRSILFCATSRFWP